MELLLKYFVLSPTSSDAKHAMASRAAIIAYANSIESAQPQYAGQLRAWVTKIEVETVAAVSSV